eukprot:m.172567 g.172567  ORF g.172567 m.172567 type:complete len:437 (+) comp15374_c1_seq2:188-1498(+)
MHCVLCGVLLPDGAKFCVTCGTPVAATTTTTIAPVATTGGDQGSTASAPSAPEYEASIPEKKIFPEEVVDAGASAPPLAPEYNALSPDASLTSVAANGKVAQHHASEASAPMETEVYNVDMQKNGDSPQRAESLAPGYDYSGRQTNPPSYVSDIPQQPPLDTPPPPAESEPLLPPSYEDDVGCWAGFQREPHSKNLFVSVCIIVVVSLRLSKVDENLQNDAVFFSVLGVLILVYLIESFRAHTFWYLLRMTDTLSVNSYFSQMCQTMPWVHWSIQCYHYETRIEHYTSTDSKGNTTHHTRTVQERVNTHSASHNYALEGYSDVSPPMTLTSHNITKVEFSRHFSWRDNIAKAKHDVAYAEWIRFHDRDTHRDINWSWGIPGFKNYIMDIREGVSLPCWFNVNCYVLWTMIGLSWPYRVCASSICGKREEKVCKVIW